MCEPSENRREERIRLEIPVLLHGGRGVSRDISSSGIYFLTGQPPTAGSSVKFTVALSYACPGRTVQFRCQGQVLRVETINGTGTLFGVAAAIGECWCMPAAATSTS